LLTERARRGGGAVAVVADHAALDAPDLTIPVWEPTLARSTTCTLLSTALPSCTPLALSSAAPSSLHCALLRSEDFALERGEVFELYARHKADPVYWSPRRLADKYDTSEWIVTTCVAG